MRKVAVSLLWGLTALVVLFLVALPVNLLGQLITGAVVVGLMILLKLIRPDGFFRLVALALGTAIVLRYVYWRTTGTLPPINQPANFIPGLLLYIAEMFNVLMLSISLFVVAAPLRRRPDAPQPAGAWPTVDVFVPSYNEDAELLATTLAAAKAMDYPPDRFTVWLLDDGGTEQKRNSERAGEALAAQRRYDELTKLCENLGCRYITRARNVHAKAGNMNNALAHSTGELIAIFDADHAPARSFLKETVGYFGEDPKLFLVQTPHFFLNPDPVERNLRTFERMPSENEMFYGIIQRGLDKWDASFFCGSAAVLRREALLVTEGFSGRSITEDCETALGLHAKGWHSVYIDKPLIAGLQPATFASFIGQRSRWAQGMMQILRFQFPPAKRGLTFPQRLCYMSSTLFWLFPFQRMMFLIAPLFYLFFDLEIFTASGQEFLAYTLSYIIVNLMMQNYLYGSYRWPWISELYEYVQSVHLLPALVSVVLNPTKPTFKVTAKDESIDRNRVSEIGTPFFIIFAVLLVGVAVTVYRVMNEPYKADVTLVVGGWNLLNLLFAGCALGVVSERAERQSSRRVTVRRRCEFLYEGASYPGTIEDVSVRGARVSVVGALPDGAGIDAPATIRFTPHGPVGADALPITIRNVQRTPEGVSVGCLYLAETAQHYQLISDLIFANSAQWTDFQASRRVNPGVIRGTIWFFSMCLFQTGRGLLYLQRHATGAEDRQAVAKVAESTR